MLCSIATSHLRGISWPSTASLASITSFSSSILSRSNLILILYISCYCTHHITSGVGLGRGCVLQMAKEHFPLRWTQLRPERIHCWHETLSLHFIYAHSAINFCFTQYLHHSLFPSLFMCPFLWHFSAIPLPLFPYCSLVVQAFLLIFFITSHKPPFSLSLS